MQTVTAPPLISAACRAASVYGRRRPPPQGKKGQ